MTGISRYRIVLSGIRLTLLLLVSGGWIAPQAQAPDPAQRLDSQTGEPMASDANPGFLVATIKASDPASTGGWAFPNDGRHVSCLNASVATILSVAYGIHIKQIVVGPDWVSKDRYDINGVPDVTGVPGLKQMQHMYQKLLADRFHLTFHRETRQMPVYGITVAKGGPRLKVADPSEEVNTGNSGSSGRRALKFTNISMSDFALNMNLYDDRPVIDQTNLTGRYDFTLKWTYDISRENDPDAPPSLFTAIKEQLGLRMDALKGPAEVFVIDHVERPSSN